MVVIIINYEEISQRRCQSLSIYIKEDRYWLGEKLHHTKYLKDSWYTWVQPIDLSQEKCTCLLNLLKNNRSNTYTTIFCKHLNKTGKFDIWEKYHLIPSLYYCRKKWLFDKKAFFSGLKIKSKINHSRCTNIIQLLPF